MPRHRKPANPFRKLNSSPELIRLVVMMYARFPLRNVEDLLFECGSETSHETVRHWWNRSGPPFANEVHWQRPVHWQRLGRMKSFRQSEWHLDEVYVTRRAA